MIVRNIEINDFESLTPLFSDLGYPSEPYSIKKRLTGILEDKSYYLIGVDFGGKIAGLCGYCVMHQFESDEQYVRILALVVGGKYRGQGYAQAMLQFVEEWCKIQGINIMTLNSGTRDERKDAHEFYQKYGFHQKSFGYSKIIE